MTNLLITGVAGFIGSKIAASAIAKGYKVFGVDDLSQGYASNVPKGVEFLEFDLVNQKNIDKLPKNIDFILHLAGQSSGEISFDDPVLDLEKNTVSTLNLIKYGIENKTKKFFYASSMSVYGNVADKQPVTEDSLCAPLSCYGVGKLAAENYLKVYQNQLPYVNFRMFNVYGPGQDMQNLRQGMVSIYLSYALNNQCIPVKGNLQRFRDFIYIDDVVNIWLQAIENPNIKNQCFNLGTGKKTSVLELLNIIKNYIPHCSWEELDQTPGDQFGVYADISLLEKTFIPNSFTDIAKGMEKFITWAHKQS